MKIKARILILVPLFFLITLLMVFANTNKVMAEEQSCCVTKDSNGSPINCLNVSTQDECPSDDQHDYYNNLKCNDGVEDCDSLLPATSTSTEFTNPIGFTTVSDLLSSILSHLMGIIAIIAIIFIVIGGIMYMLSAGDEAMVTRAKKTWTGAVIGLAIALAAPTFLKEIKSILSDNTVVGGSADSWVSNALTIHDIAVRVLNLLLSVVGVIAIIALVIGGGMYLTAYGDEKRIDTGKKTITYAILGIVVTLAAIIIVRQVATLLGY